MPLFYMDEKYRDSYRIEQVVSFFQGELAIAKSESKRYYLQSISLQKPASSWVIQQYRTLNHPLVIPCIEVYSEGNYLVLVRPYEPIQPLHQAISTGEVDEEQLIEWTKQLIELAKRLKEKPLPMYLLLDPRNMGISEDNRLKVFFCGLAQITSPQSLGDWGTFLYSALSGEFVETRIHQLPRKFFASRPMKRLIEKSLHNKPLDSVIEQIELYEKKASSKNSLIGRFFGGDKQGQPKVDMLPIPSRKESFPVTKELGSTRSDDLLDEKDFDQDLYPSIETQFIQDEKLEQERLEKMRQEYEQKQKEMLELQRAELERQFQEKLEKQRSEFEKKEQETIQKVEEKEKSSQADSRKAVDLQQPESKSEAQEQQDDRGLNQESTKPKQVAQASSDHGESFPELEVLKEEWTKWESKEKERLEKERQERRNLEKEHKKKLEHLKKEWLEWDRKEKERLEQVRQERRGIENLHREEIERLRKERLEWESKEKEQIEAKRQEFERRKQELLQQAGIVEEVILEASIIEQKPSEESQDTLPEQQDSMEQQNQVQKRKKKKKKKKRPVNSDGEQSGEMGSPLDAAKDTEIINETAE